jgi:arylsulfatase A-like enzyme
MKRILIGLLCVLGSLVVQTGTAQRPNVLFIAVDDLNDWIGCLKGHPQALTPNMDRLAGRGMLFANAHCAAPACNPSRAAVFSGRLPGATGVWSNKSRKLLAQRPNLELLPMAFSRAGYLTMGTGKLLHSGAASKAGFSQSFSVEQRWSPFTKEAVEYTPAELPSKGTGDPHHVVKDRHGRTIILPFNRMPSDRRPGVTGGESFDWGPVDVSDSEMGDTRITDWAIGKLKAGFDRPFFLGVGYYRPHIPLFAPKKYFERFKETPAERPPFKSDDLADLSDAARKWAIEPITAGSHATVVKHGQWRAAVEAYLACVTYVDHEIGRLLDVLDETGGSDNTVIVLWSDHGWHLGEKRHWGKWTGWERSTRVPLIIVPSAKSTDRFASAGSRCDQAVGLIDLYPTLTELCGITPTGGLHGHSLVPLLRNPQRATDRAVVTLFDPGNASVRTERWRYVRYADGNEELYDHRKDPNEWDNLAGIAKFDRQTKILKQALECRLAAPGE